MNISIIHKVSIDAISACVPRKTINNREFAKQFFKNDLSSTINALGVEERHIVENDSTTALDLCVEAANSIFDSNFIRKSDIGALVFVTLTPDCLMPNNASFAQYKLGLPNEIPAFDINHACSGYVYGLWNAALIASNLNKKVLLLDGDVNSHYISPWDRSTALIFGDAGTATVVTPNNEADDCRFTFDTDGKNRDCILLRIGFRDLLKHDMLNYITQNDGSRRRVIDMEMDGERVFNYVVTIVPKIIMNFMDEIETSPEEYDKLILHQANYFMLRKLAKKIGFQNEKMPISLDKYGNTSSVSIPLTICSELKNESISKVLIAGMGAGLATGVGDINMSGIKNYGVREISL